MGLFSRNDNSSNNDDMDLELPTREDFQQPLVDEPGPKTSPKTAPSKRYSIDDAIELLRHLPESEDRQTMSVICKTLESAQIRMSDLLQDAQHKEHKLKQEHKELEQDIEQLQAKIDERRKQLQQLSESLEEVIRIKARFEQSLGKPKNTNAPEAASKPAAKQASAEAPSAQPKTDKPPKTDTSAASAEKPTPEGPAGVGRRTRGGGPGPG